MALRNRAADVHIAATLISAVPTLLCLVQHQKGHSYFCTRNDFSSADVLGIVSCPLHSRGPKTLHSTRCQRLQLKIDFIYNSFYGYRASPVPHNRESFLSTTEPFFKKRLLSIVGYSTLVLLFLNVSLSIVGTTRVVIYYSEVFFGNTNVFLSRQFPFF